jgi:hypothetical protein
MLKLIYTETDVHIELLTAELEDWVEQRLLFSNSTGETILISSGTASFLLPTTMCEATAINFYLHHQGATTVTASYCDLDSIEIGLTGYWLSPDSDSDLGVFVTQLSERLAVCLDAHNSEETSESLAKPSRKEVRRCDSNRVEFYLWQLWCSGNSRSVISDGVIN